MKNIVVTGAAGFIGFHTTVALLRRGHSVVGIDNLNDYYDVSLKRARLACIRPEESFEFVCGDISAKAEVGALFERAGPELVIHLAAQAGVRHSLVNPDAYIASNVVGCANILEQCVRHNVKHLVFASSSSVYGLNTSMPYSEHHGTDHPANLYAATKKAGEAMAHAYSFVHALPVTGLRFFTVYGPWGRPDMAPMLFAKAIAEGQPIRVHNDGRMQRDFTYIDDIVEGITRVASSPTRPTPGWDCRIADSATSSAPYRIYNIGCGQPVDLLKFIGLIEGCMGRTVEKIYVPMQPGELEVTWADRGLLETDFGRMPATPIETGVAKFVEWFRAWYRPQT